MKPKVSVMLCTYNSSGFINEAVDSILAQTYQDFEFIIVDDGSTDDTLLKLTGYHDPRIRIISCKHDYIHSLNIGIKACRGEFIARMDADDKAMPIRLERQVTIMEKHPDMTVCFSWGLTFGDFEDSVGHCARGWVKNAFFWLITGNYLMHPSAMIRKVFLQKHHLFYKNYPYAEDYKLWTDITRLGGTLYVIPEPLFYYRICSSQVSNIYHDEQNNTRLMIQQEVIEELLRRVKHPQKNNLKKLYYQMLVLNQAELMQGDEVVSYMYRILRRMHYFT